MSRIVKKGSDGSIEVVNPSVRSLVERTKYIISDTIDALARKASGNGLNGDDAQILSVCVKALRSVAMEEREIEKESKLKNLTKEQLAELAKKLFAQESDLMKSLKGESINVSTEPENEVRGRSEEDDGTSGEA